MFTNVNRLFEDLATDVIEECYHTNTKLARMLIESPHPHWKHKTPLTMAAEAQNKVRIIPLTFGSKSRDPQRINLTHQFQALSIFITCDVITHCYSSRNKSVPYV